MDGFRVFYRQGSFALADMCGTYDEAIAHARLVQSRRGVWLVRIEDADGRRLRGGYDVYPAWEGLRAIGSEAGAVRKLRGEMPAAPNAGPQRPPAAYAPSGSGLTKSAGDAYADDELSLPLTNRSGRRASVAR